MKHFLIILFSVFAYIVSAQNSTKVPKTIDELEVSIIDSDLIGNYYLVDTDGNLHKADTSGTIIASYQNQSALPISHMDVSDPLNILIYYKDFEVLEFLNSDLSPRGNVIQLSNIGKTGLDAACRSYENGFWLFSSDEGILFKSNLNLKIHSIIETYNMLESGDNILRLFENGKYLFLVQKNKGIFIWDIYGSYYKTIPADNLIDARIYKDKAYILNDEGVMVYDLNFPVLGTISYENNYQSFCVTPYKILFLSENKVISKSLNQQNE